MIRIVFVLALIGSFLGCSTKQNGEADRSVNITELVNLSAEEVIKKYGQPDSVFVRNIVTKRILTHQYRNRDLVEIQYPEGVATDIIITRASSDFNPGILKDFGLSEKRPTETRPGKFYKWRDYPQFHVVNMYVVKFNQEEGIKEYNIFFKAKGS